MKLFILLLVFLVLSSTTAQRCQPGTFRSGTTCQQCPVGTFQSRVEASRCLFCSRGRRTLSTGAQGRDLCARCPEGTFGGGENECKPCPQGSTSLPGAPNVERCLPCGPGSMISRNGRRCIRCGRNTFSSAEANVACTSCPEGSFSPPGSTSIDDCRTPNCPPGSVVSFTASCVACSSGRIDPIRSQCLLCPAGTCPDQATGDAEPCPPCRPRSFNAGGRTERCLPGTVALGRGSTVCRRINGPCPLDSVERRDGACVRCPFHERINPTTGLCEICPENTRAESPTATQCTRCPGDMIPSRTIRPACVCPPGTGLSRNGRCTTCRRGTSGFLSLRECTACAQGLVAPERGMSECVPCPSGMIPNEDRTRCINCPEGTATDIGPLGLPTNLLVIDTDVCRSVQTGCPIGFRRSTLRSLPDCVPIICRGGTPAGTDCRRCKVGTEPIVDTLLRRAFSCRKCLRNEASNGLRCRDCPRGMLPSLGDGSQCSCGEGRGFRNGICVLCPPGTFSTFDDDRCRPCAPGTISERRGSGSCESCPIDHFTNMAGASRCQMCPQGTFTYGNGETECLEFLV